MGYTKQGFYSGGKLKASQLEAMEDGIIEAQQLSHNMESGSGDFAVQQVPEVGSENGFDFTGRNAHAIELDPSLAAVLPYGATGDYSSAFGSKNASMAKRAMAIGNKTVAKGEESLAAGYQSVTLSSGCFAHGTETVAGMGKVDGVEKGASAHSEGYHTVAIGDGSHAEGIDTLAGGDYSHSEGNITRAEGYASHAEGDKAWAVGDASHAEGNLTKAYGLASHAEGSDTQAHGFASHAGGVGTIATADGKTVFGYFNEDKADTVFEVGFGVSDSERVNGLEVYKTGLVSVGDRVQQIPRADKVSLQGDETIPSFNFTGHPNNNHSNRIMYGAVGPYSASFNGRSGALGKHSFAINNSTVAMGEESFSQGYETIAEGNSSFAGGSRTWAKAEAATALGAQTIAEGKASIALGSQSIAHGEASFAQGWGAKAYGNYSTVIGQETQTGWGKEQGYTGGLCSFAGGYRCNAFGNYSFAFGHSSAALATNSFAFGYRTQALYKDQFVLGRCNKENSNALLIIGCGTDDRQDNAFEVYSDGDIGIKKGDKIYSLHKMLAAYFTDANLKA